MPSGIPWKMSWVSLQQTELFSPNKKRSHYVNDFMHLVTMAFEALEAANGEHMFCQELRAKYGISPGDPIPVASLQAGDAFQLGEMAGQTTERWERVKRIAILLNVSVYSLISAVKSMSRWNSHHEIYGGVVNLRTEGDAARMRRFISMDNKGKRYYQSTGRSKWSRRTSPRPFAIYRQLIYLCIQTSRLSAWVGQRSPYYSSMEIPLPAPKIFS